LSGQLRRRLTREQLQRVAVQLAGVEDSVFALPRLFQAINPLLGLSIDVVHRPSIVLFGEALAEPAWGRALSECAACDLMLVVGTSGAVHPAAGLPDLAARRGVRVVGVGPEAGTADLWLHGPAGAVLPELVRSVQASA
jgi:NAD-dependent deacetylase